MFVERQPKPLRTSYLSTQYGARSSYLDTVPEEVLRGVLRYWASRPHHENWHTFVSVHSVRTLLEVGGALARAASLEFHDFGGTNGIPLATDDDFIIFRLLVPRLTLRRLHLRFFGTYALPEILRWCGAELRELALNALWGPITETDIYAISVYCTKLSSLSILAHYGKSPLAPIWRSLGSNLTRIYIDPEYEVQRIFSVAELAEHCVNLRRVDTVRLNREIVGVLTTLGTRIRVLCVEYELALDIDYWREVLRSCANLDAVHLKLPHSVQVMDVLRLLRTKLVSLKFDGLHAMDYPLDQDKVTPIADRFFSLLSACSALREVEFSKGVTFSEVLVRKLFESIKSVTSLTCDMTPFEDPTLKKSVDAMASNLRNLESVTMSTLKPLRGEDVNALVDLPRLKSVKLRTPSFNCVLNPAEQCAVEVVKRLKPCTQLVQLEIDDVSIKNRSQLIAQAAAMYGRKNFDMFIGGVLYRTW